MAVILASAGWRSSENGAASGLKASEFVAAVRPVTVGTHFDGRCLSRPGLLERGQVQRLEADLETLFRCVTGLPDRN